MKLDAKPAKKMTQRSIQALKRRKELLSAAKKLFAQNGYHATSTRSINQSIGMADGLIYHYFPRGKKQILESIIEEETAEKMKGFEEALHQLNRDLPLQEILFGIGKILLHYATRDRDLMIILLRENHLLHEDFFKPYLDFKLRLMQEIADILTYKVKKKEMNNLDVNMMVLQFVSPFTLYIIQQIFAADLPLPDEEAFIRQIAEHTAHIWTGKKGYS